MGAAAAMTLAEASQRCRLTQKQANDVRWFFSDAQGELGLRAMNLEPNRGRALDFDDTKVAAAQERYDRINAILDAMGQSHQWAVRRFYEPAIWRGLEIFGPLAGLALRSGVAKRGYRRETGAERAGAVVFETWLKGVAARVKNPKGANTADDAKLVATIIADCERDLTSACRAYQKHELLLQLTARKERRARRRFAMLPWEGLPEDDE